MSLDATEIATVYFGFRRGDAEPTNQVRLWAESVVRGGSWRLSDPEGMVQEILLKLFELARAGKVRTPGGFQKLVYTVARYRCVDGYYKDRRRRETESGDDDFDQVASPDGAADEALAQAERRQLLSYIFQRLSERCRHLWGQVYREQRPAAEIAEELGISANNLRVRVHRCLEKAKQIYSDISAVTPPGGDDE